MTAMSTEPPPKDHWSTEAYTSAAGFVPQLTSTVVTYLDVQPTDHILDVGCGDGQLTAQIARAAHSGKVVGLDSSESFIATAKEKFSLSNTAFILHDARSLESCPDVTTGQWDKVFSNAALHWILREPKTREDFFSNIHRALKPGGRFVFEMGGHGNVSEVHAATVAALLNAGVSSEKALDANPWYFPAPEEVREILTQAGFEVEKCELEYRSTKLTEVKEDGSGGIEGWVKLMCAQFLDAAPENLRGVIVGEICTVLDPIITKKDGSKWLGYVRLRAVAKKA